MIMPSLTASSALLDSMIAGVLSFALRATVLLAAAWLLTRLMRRASAATRHLVWTAGIVGVLLLPLLAAWLPRWDVPVMTIAARTDAPPATIPDPDRQTSRTPVQVTAASAAAAVEPPRSFARAEPSSTDMALAQLRAVFSARTFLALAWLTLALLLLARLAIANARVSSWRRSSAAVEDDAWQALLRRLCRRYGIERPVVLLENPDSDVPVTWGVIYPVVLLPAAAETWDEEQRIAVLTHELAHVKRFDALTQLLAQLALALLWFHPLVWMAVRRMRLEREHSCDDFVLVAGARASRYADDLLGFARRLTRPTAPAAAALAMARRSELEGRLLAILDPAAKRETVRAARVGALALGVIVLAAPLAAFRPAARVESAMARNESAPLTPKGNVAGPAAPRAAAPSAPTVLHAPPALAALSLESSSLEALTRRLKDMRPSATLSPLDVPALARAHPDTEPPRYVDVQTLIDVTRAAKRMTSDNEKGQLLQLIAKRYQRNDALRDAYLDAVSTMTSDLERSQALIALLDRDSLPVSAAPQVLRSAAMMTSDMNRGQVLKRISPAAFADTAVQRAYLEVIVSMTSDMERGAAIGALVKQRPLSTAVQLALLRAMAVMTGNTDKAAALMLFIDKQGIDDDTVRRALLKTAETLTSDSDYRRVITAVMK